MQERLIFHRCGDLQLVGIFCEKKQIYSFHLYMFICRDLCHRTAGSLGDINIQVWIKNRENRSRTGDATMET